MAPLHPTHFLIVGAGATGLMTARELARAGKRATILEARERCGGQPAARASPPPRLRREQVASARLSRPLYPPRRHLEHARQPGASLFASGVSPSLLNVRGALVGVGS